MGQVHKPKSHERLNELENEMENALMMTPGGNVSEEDSNDARSHMDDDGGQQKGKLMRHRREI